MTADRSTAGIAEDVAGQRAGSGAGSADLDLGRFLGEQPTRDTADWLRLWQEDREFPVESGRSGLAGRLVRLAKRLLRPFVRLGSSGARERQRIFNLIVVEAIAEMRQLGQRVVDLDQHLKQVHRDHQRAIEAHAGRLEQLDVRTAEGLRDVMGHNDALFARVDQKLDRYRREARELSAKLGAVVAAQETGGAQAAAGGDSSARTSAVAAALAEQTYFELERRWRGTEAEIKQRVSALVPHLARGQSKPVLDLGCGRGELLSVLAASGIQARGVDRSAAMVARCRAQNLDVVEGDLLAVLAAVEAESLGGVVSLHVIEHLAFAQVERMVRLAWRALAPGGVLALETPSPLSLVVSSSSFWIDPTHLRPVHPAWLEVVFREAGFEPVHRLDLHPFPDLEHLPEISLEALHSGQQPLADGVNRLRDKLDRLLFGCRDYALIGIKG